jgi:hypothetical protein
LNNHKESDQIHRRDTGRKRFTITNLLKLQLIQQNV